MEIDGDRLNSVSSLSPLSLPLFLALSLAGLPMETDGAGPLASAPAD